MNIPLNRLWQHNNLFVGIKSLGRNVRARSDKINVNTSETQILYFYCYCLVYFMWKESGGMCECSYLHVVVDIGEAI